MTAIKALKFTVVVVFLSLVCLGAGLLLYCDSPSVHNWPGETELNECYDNCGCEKDSFFPVCGSDQKTYYSPCFAGCQKLTSEVYTNCTCIDGGTAHSGMCDYSCDYLIPYILSIAFRSLFGTLSIVPKMVVYIRCVEHRDRSMAIGFSTFMTAMLGWMVGPIAFGYFIDGICTVWDVNCGVIGRCLLYDNHLFRLKYHAYSGFALLASLLSLTTAFIYAKRTGCLEEKDGDVGEKEENEKLKAADEDDNGEHEDETRKYGLEDITLVFDGTSIGVEEGQADKDEELTEKTADDSGIFTKC